MFKDLGALMSLMGNRDKIQAEVARFQQTVATISAEGTSGGGAVTVTVNGKLEVLSCKFGEDAWKLNDRAVLEELVVSATNQALNKVREQLNAETQKMAASLGLPPGMLGGLPGLG